MSAAASGARQRLTRIVLTTVLAIPALLLFREFSVPGYIFWNVLLGSMLSGVIVAAICLHHFSATHAGEIGEARFDTRNKSQIDG